MFVYENISLMNEIEIVSVEIHCPLVYLEHASSLMLVILR